MTFDDLLRAARTGSEDAIGALWRDLQPRLLRYLRSLAPDIADDLASETWLQAARDLHRFEGGETEFRAWLFTIARNRLIDWRRRVARRPELVVAQIEEQRDDGRRDDDTASLVLDHLGTEAALRLVGALPPDQAEVILLRVVGGLDAARVAAIMGKRPGTVRVLQHRALRRLATALAETERHAGVTK